MHTPVSRLAQPRARAVRTFHNGPLGVHRVLAGHEPLRGLIGDLPFELADTAVGGRGSGFQGAAPVASLPPERSMLFLAFWLSASLVAVAGFAERAEITR
jgi:hypothetical protein